MSRRRWAVALTAVAAAAVLVGGATAAAFALGNHDDTAPAAAPRPSASANAFAADGLQNPAAPAPTTVHADPTTVTIPSLGVTSSLEHLGLGSAGELTAPVDWDRAGWYADGVVPGEIGPAIIAGHVDSPTAPAVFYRIAELQPGDEVIVDTADGESLTFVVTGSTQSSKSTFPTAEVYSNVPRPELRLITCAGAFDSSIGHYTDNLIVFASLAE
jgi:sortase (surface protein transpeptidase)